MTAEPEPDLIVRGDRVALGPLRRDLAATYARWVNHADVRAGLGNVGIATPHSEEAWIDETVKAAAEPEPKTASFTVYDLTDREPVGTASLFGISYLNGTATFGIALGQRRSLGLGSEATRLVVEWGFRALGLQNILLETFAWNTAAIRAYENAGFRHIGVRRQAAISRGERCDVVLMDALRSDFAGAAAGAAADVVDATTAPPDGGL
jgi:diamine N-acetyltransferase